MSEHDYDFPKTTVSQVVLSVVGGLFAPGLVIFLIVKLLLGIQAHHLVDANSKGNDGLIEERIKPVAMVTVVEPSRGPHVDKTGAEVVGAVCSACHAVGALGSPKIGDKAAWGPRIAQGYQTLISHALSGIRQMPARGGNPDLTDNEIANAIAYMANQGGAKFVPPEAGGNPNGAAGATASPAPAASSAPAVPTVAKPASAAKAAAKTEETAQQEKPVESAVAEAPPSPPVVAGKSGEEVVKAVCSMCHGVGALGSPKIGDKAAWEPRIAQGYDTLIQHALKGIRMMPARGGNPALTDGEVARAVAYMANQGGANFTPPNN